MGVTQTDLWYTYNDNLGVSSRRSFANVADTIINVQAQVFDETLVDNGIYPGGSSPSLPKKIAFLEFMWYIYLTTRPPAP